MAMHELDGGDSRGAGSARRVISSYDVAYYHVVDTSLRPMMECCVAPERMRPLVLAPEPEALCPLRTAAVAGRVGGEGGGKPQTEEERETAGMQPSPTKKARV